MYSSTSYYSRFKVPVCPITNKTALKWECSNFICNNPNKQGTKTWICKWYGIIQILMQLMNEMIVRSILSSNQSKPKLILIILCSRSYWLILSRARVLKFAWAWLPSCWTSVVVFDHEVAVKTHCQRYGSWETLSDSVAGEKIEHCSGVENTIYLSTL